MGIGGDGKMKITDTYHINFDSHNAILQKKTIIQKGKNAGSENFVDIAYCNDLARALKKWQHLEMNDNNPKTIDEMIDLLVRIENKIEEVGKGVK